MMLSAFEIGEKIAIARKMQNLSQAQLAESLAISPQAVGKWERGESMPDIIMFQRLAAALGVDLNYFGDSTPASPTADAPSAEADDETEAPVRSRNWDMSRGNWVDADFSGLSGLAERFSGANIERCQFVGSDLSGLTMKGNNIAHSDFSRSNLKGCSFTSTSFEDDAFTDCDLSKSTFISSSIGNCDLSSANLTDAVFKRCGVRRVKLGGTALTGTAFLSGQLSEAVIDGDVVDCSFEDCTFPRVEFKGATIRNSFFKNCGFKRATFTKCKIDKISYAFLKTCKADLSDVEIIEGQ